MAVLSLTRRGLIAGTAALLAVRGADAQGGAPFLLRAADADIPLGPGEALRGPAFGAAAGPALDLRRGEPFALTLDNGLDFPIHFRPHGLRGKAVAGADMPVAPGETRQIEITPPDAGTFVYRAVIDDPANAVRTLLLSGPVLVTADVPRVADQDAVVALNALLIPAPDPATPARRVVFVNGAPDLTLAARPEELAARPEEKVRLRIINLAPDAPCAVKLPGATNIVALDGQPCAPFPPSEGRLVLPPFARADVVVEVPRDADGGMELTDDFEPGRVLVRIGIAGERMEPRTLARNLPDNPRLPKDIKLQGSARATWKIGDPPPETLVKARTGQAVVLTFVNGPLLYSILLEGHSARHLDSMDDGWKPWWHDTYLLQPDETARLAFLPKEPGRFAVDLIPLQGDAAPVRSFIEVSASS